MKKLLRVPLALGLLLGAGITVGSTFIDLNQSKAEVSIMADCCQESNVRCNDRYGFTYADSRLGPDCGPIAH